MKQAKTKIGQLFNLQCRMFSFCNIHCTASKVSPIYFQIRVFLEQKSSKNIIFMGRFMLSRLAFCNLLTKLMIINYIKEDLQVLAAFCLFYSDHIQVVLLCAQKYRLSLKTVSYTLKRDHSDHDSRRYNARLIVFLPVEKYFYPLWVSFTKSLIFPKKV